MGRRTARRVMCRGCGRALRKGRPCPHCEPRIVEAGAEARRPLAAVSAAGLRRTA
jgi:hypothetical protein